MRARASEREAVRDEMGDEEMALVPDVQYGLSSHGNFDEYKSLIFVKLTDSSQRAITEYLKIRVSTSCCPSVLFALGRLGSSHSRARESSSRRTCVCMCVRALVAAYVCRNNVPRE